MSYYTEATPVTGPVGIWAIPKGRYDPEDAPPFSYRLSTEHLYAEGAVCVHTVDNVTLVVPPGINLVARAIETLEKERTNAFDRYIEIADRISLKVEQLKLLSGPVAGGSVEAGTVEVLDRETL